MSVDSRQRKGLEIANSPNQIDRINNGAYRVQSQTNDSHYWVTRTEKSWSCSCPDHKYREVRCKHIYAVEFSIALRKEVEARRIQPIEVDSCVFCGSSNIVKDGLRRNKLGDIQKFNCKVCERYFTVNIGFERMKHNPQAITTAMQLYFSGESLRNTMRSLRLLGVNVSHQTVYKWIRKYVKRIEEYADKLKPQVSDIWRADELFVKVRGDIKYVFALMDDETRYWIAQEVADTKYTHDARRLFREGKEVTGKRPTTLITDGLPSYHDAYLKEYRTLRQDTRHIRHINLRGGHHNNKMERMNGEVRDREKTMRGLKKTETPILKGYQIFHNYMRPHEALNGKTPAEASGIKVEGDNKWLTLIQNATFQAD